MTDAVEQSGYRQNGDVGQSIPIRRRWIALSALVGSDDPVSTIERDLRYWQTMKYEHEIDELLLQLPSGSKSARAVGEALAEIAGEGRLLLLRG